MIKQFAVIGYCKKLSGGRSILQDRYLKLSTNGILSWYKGEDDAESQGAIMIRGQRLTLDQDDPRVVFIHIAERRYHFQFLDEENAKLWTTALQGQLNLTPQSHRKLKVRNPIKKKQNEE